MSKAYIEKVGIKGFLWQFGHFDAPMNASPKSQIHWILFHMSIRERTQ